jgi:hypothetical protein
MSNLYRKKPVVIEAFQMTRERRADNKDWPIWLHDAWNKEWMEDGAVFGEDRPDSDGTDALCVQTLEGVMRVGWGDYIIKGIKGELHPCKSEIFLGSYDKFDKEPRAWPRYQCHKVVRALKIGEGATVNPNGTMLLNIADGGFEPVRVSKEVVARHLPMPGDYLVEYEDGYRSISPGKVFEEGYDPIP